MSKHGGWPESGFADRLRELRERAGVSQAQLAERVGVHTLSISKLERGLHEPLWPLVLAIAKALGKPVQDFVADGEAAPGAAPKRPPGRPRKAPPEGPADGAGAAAKRPRGRPRMAK
jgi:transcriptional regulator with XRE-family HTH domain